MRQLASRAGRDPDSMELVKFIYLSIGNDRARARAPMARYLGSFYSGRYDVDRWCAFGPPAECAAFIRSFLNIGNTTVMLCMMRPDARQLERLHREVVPLLR